MEAVIKTELPPDYKVFINTYGTGSIDSFLWVLNPFSSNKHLNLLDQLSTTLDAFRVFQKDSGVELAYPLYPLKGGLIPWAASDNGDVLFCAVKANQPNGLW